MKYNIRDLVIRRGMGEKAEYYFVCKFNSMNNCYVEILTNEEIEGTGEDIYPTLDDYYSETTQEAVGNLKVSRSRILEDYPKINAYYKEKYGNLDSKHYVMEDEYDADSLMVAYLEFETVHTFEDEVWTEREFSDERYILKLIEVGGWPKLQEVFTGFVTDRFGSGVVQVAPLAKVVPRLKGERLSKMDLFLLQNEINHPTACNDKKMIKTKEND